MTPARLPTGCPEYEDGNRHANTVHLQMKAEIPLQNKPSLDRSHVSVRRATVQDADAVLSLVDALADYEKLPRPDEAARERLARDAFGDRRRVEIYLAEVENTPVGYAIVLETYSSFLALPTLYLEDLFVLPGFRSRKIGLTLFHAMACVARARGCGRMEWTVLDWNSLAIDFYKKLGASHLKEWHLYRLTAAEIETITSLMPDE